MSLQFVIGPASGDHQATLVTLLQQAMAKAPHDRFFYLIPNHIKFGTEVGVLSALKTATAADQPFYAQNRLQVFSFTRLAWYFMKNTAYYQLPRLDQAGLNMLVTQLLQVHQTELTIFRGEQQQVGFVAMVAGQLVALQQAQLTPALLADVIADLPQDANQDLVAKLHDLQVLYPDFVTAFKQRYLANTDLLTTLADYLQQISLADTHFIIAGYNQMTGQEQRLVQVLMAQSQSVVLDLMLDQPAATTVPDPQSLFFKPAQLYHQLYQFARQRQIPVLMDVRTKPARTADLLAVEQYWQASTDGTATPAAAPLTDPASLQIITAPNRYRELQQVATRIRQLVAKKGYRYRDFLVMTRHLTPYETILAPIFKAQQIPYFADLTHQMADHPLLELITALFNIQRRYYRYQDMMRLLKTELLRPQDLTVAAYRQAVDLTENMVLKYGFEGQQWLRQEDWQFYRFADHDFGVETTADQQITEQVNQIRHYVKATLPAFFEKMAAADTGTAAITILYQFLVQQGVPQRLMAWRDQALAVGDLTTAAEPEQVWQTFCKLLDEYVDLLGAQPFVAADFLATLTAGFNGASYAQIPSTLDQVLVSETGIVQGAPRKIVFIIGATDQVMPDRQVQEQLLSDQDQERLAPYLPATMQLSESLTQRFAGEAFLNYLAFLNAQEQLIFTCPELDDAGALQLSPYVQRLQQQFQVEPQAVPAPTLTSPVQPYLGAPRVVLSELVQIVRQAQSEKTPLPAVWRLLYQEIRRQPALAALSDQALAGLTYHNEPEPLRPEIVQGLYGKLINTSISKLEEFYQNQYAYFLKYGLKLQERDVFQLSPASTGEFYHAALDQLLTQIKAQGQSIAQLAPAAIDKLVTQICQDLQAQPQFQILKSSNRMAYLAKQLVQTVRQMGFAMRQQGQRTKMEPLQTEVLFGHVGSDQGLQPLRFELPNQKVVQVRGKIDRIDQLVLPGERYLGIVDYKSSAHQFNFRDAYYGLALQMLTYLTAVMQNVSTLTGADQQTVQPAGAVYLHLQNPKLKLQDVLKQSFDEAVLAANKYDGILLNDENLLAALDEDLAAARTGHSPVYPLQKTISHGYASRDSKLVTSQELDLLLAHNAALIKAAGTAIFAGADALNPVKWPDQHTALQYSPYQPIFQFDAMLPENQYNQLDKLTPQKVIEMLRHEQTKGDA